MLRAHDIHAQFPIREKRYHQRGKAVVRKLPVITQVVYAQFKAAPQWDILKRRRLITGVYGRNAVPIAIPYDVIRAVMGLPTVAEELEAARRELLRVREGDRAEITLGPLSGLVVDVREVMRGACPPLVRPADESASLMTALTSRGCIRPCLKRRRKAGSKSRVMGCLL